MTCPAGRVYCVQTECLRAVDPRDQGEENWGLCGPCARRLRDNGRCLNCECSLHRWNLPPDRDDPRDVCLECLDQRRRHA